MTGEISLKGHVLAIGGVKEKVIAAYNQNIKRVILPSANKKDLDEIPKQISEKIDFVFVDHIEEVIINSFPTKKQIKMPQF